MQDAELHIAIDAIPGQIGAGDEEGRFIGGAFGVHLGGMPRPVSGASIRRPVIEKCPSKLSKGIGGVVPQLPFGIFGGLQHKAHANAPAQRLPQGVQESGHAVGRETNQKDLLLCVLDDVQQNLLCRADRLQHAGRPGPDEGTCPAAGLFEKKSSDLQCRCQLRRGGKEGRQPAKGKKGFTAQSEATAATFGRDADRLRM